MIEKLEEKFSIQKEPQYHIHNTEISGLFNNFYSKREIKSTITYSKTEYKSTMDVSITFSTLSFN